MRQFSAARLWAPIAVAVTLVVLAGPASAQVNAASTGSTLRMVDLGTLGGESSYAIAMNDRGDVIGNSAVADGSYHGFVWHDGTMTDLGALDPVDINNRGEIAGTIDGIAVVRSRSGRVVRLGTLGGLFSRPVAINDDGHVVGVSDTADFRNAVFGWKNGTMRELPLGDVSDISNRGHVSGGQFVGAGFHASVWHRGVVTDLGALDFDRSNTYGVNDNGWVIGWVFSPEQRERGALWRDGVLTDVGTLGGGTTTLVAINDRGAILAYSQLADGFVHPALWRGGAFTDLTTLGVSAEADLADLNNRGQIAATVRPVFGISHAVLYR
jgi:probable HAF family extracellular repeat protein